MLILASDYIEYCEYRIEALTARYQKESEAAVKKLAEYKALPFYKRWLTCTPDGEVYWYLRPHIAPFKTELARTEYQLSINNGSYIDIDNNSGFFEWAINGPT